MELKELLVKIAKILDDLEIPYLVTGGVAVVTWGRMRFTQDIDLVVSLRDEKIPMLARQLRTLGEGTYIEEDVAREALIQKGEFNFIHPESGVKVDFWILKDDPLSKSQLIRAVAISIGEQPVRFLSPEDLILSKLLWYKESESSRHFEDAESVIAIQGDKLDKEYLKQWAERQNISYLLSKILKL